MAIEVKSEEQKERSLQVLTCLFWMKGRIGGKGSDKPT